MAKSTQKIHALQLRAQGTSVSDIARTVGVSKSTVSHWCRDIALSKQAIRRIASRSNVKSTTALLSYTESLRAKRKQDIASDMSLGKRHLGKLNDRDVYCIGLGLYWGEGYKRGSQELGFTNSDPRMIRFYMRWLDAAFGITRSDLILRISINEIHTNRIEAVTRYWMQITKIQKSNFTKTSLIRSRSKKIYLNTEEHMGTLRIKVRRGTRLRRQILGAIEAAGTYAEKFD